MRIAIASDHGGFEQKEQIARHLRDLGHEVDDLGCDSTESVDYPDYAEKVAQEVSDGTAERGVLICGTGIGMALVADKFPGVRAASIQRPDFAALFRHHNDGNVVCLSGRFVPLETNEQVVDTFLETGFDGGRHSRRVEKIEACDRR